MRKLTCNAEHCKDRDDDGLDDEGGELLQGLLIRLPHLLYVRSIPGEETCASAANKFNGIQITFTQVIFYLPQSGLLLLYTCLRMSVQG